MPASKYRRESPRKILPVEIGAPGSEIQHLKHGQFSSSKGYNSGQRARVALKNFLRLSERLYYLYSANKGTDQLRGYREADLRLCFRICKKPVFSGRGSNGLSANRRLRSSALALTTQPPLFTDKLINQWAHKSINQSCTQSDWSFHLGFKEWHTDSGLTYESRLTRDDQKLCGFSP